MPKVATWKDNAHYLEFQSPRVDPDSLVSWVVVDVVVVVVVVVVEELWILKQRIF
jgi:hypothetical protein